MLWSKLDDTTRQELWSKLDTVEQPAPHQGVKLTAAARQARLPHHCTTTSLRISSRLCKSIEAVNHSSTTSQRVAFLGSFTPWICTASLPKHQYHFLLRWKSFCEWRKSRETCTWKGSGEEATSEVSRTTCIWTLTMTRRKSTTRGAKISILG